MMTRKTNKYFRAGNDSVVNFGWRTEFVVSFFVLISRWNESVVTISTAMKFKIYIVETKLINTFYWKIHSLQTWSPSINQWISIPILMNYWKMKLPPIIVWKMDKKYELNPFSTSNRFSLLEKTFEFHRSKSSFCAPRGASIFRPAKRHIRTKKSENISPTHEKWEIRVENCHIASSSRSWNDTSN